MTRINEVTTFDLDGDVAVITIDSPPVNALSFNVREGIVSAMAEAESSDANAVVLICAGRTFIAGADITEFGGPPKGPSLAEVQASIEGSSKPVVAAIHGTALGGGLEVALCAHYRIAVPSAKCGLPEVKLGLLPGAGGTQRLPRVVGVPKALQMMTFGDHIPASECHEMGLVDELATEGKLAEDAVALAQRVLAEERPLVRVRDANDKVVEARDHPEVFDEFRKTNARKFRGFEAPEKIIQTVEAAVALPFDEGIDVERKLFMELMSGEQAAAQQYLFFADRQTWKIPDVGRDIEALPVETVGIIGAGTMGGGIAMNFVNAGIPVTIIETTAENLERGLGVVRSNYDRSTKRGRFTAEEVEQRMGLITGSLDMNDIADVDLVIEAVFEDMDVKKEIFARLDKIARPGAVLATNTSALDINQIAGYTKRPESVIGMHFFSPANVMKLVEVVRADKTSKPVIQTAMAVSRRIGKIASLVGVCPGFVGNRMLFARRSASEALLRRGVMPWDIDAAITDFGFAMGPYQMSDLAGLDIGWKRETSTGSSIRERLNEAGRHGQKVGAGYYDYDENRRSTPSKLTEEIVLEFADEGANGSGITSDEITERLTMAMVNEAAKILDEGIAIRSSDIDVIWVYGYNWPRYRGGPMFWADSQGLDNIVARLSELESAEGELWAPAPLLVQLASEGKKFRDWKPAN